MTLLELIEDIALDGVLYGKEQANWNGLLEDEIRYYRNMKNGISRLVTFLRNKGIDPDTVLPEE